jgi:hypothetical protein
VVCLFCNFCVLCNFHLYMVFVIWFPSCVLGSYSYAIVSGTCLELVVDTIWMVNIMLFGVCVLPTKVVSTDMKAQNKYL